MNLKYMMLKDRYVFSYGPELILYSPEDEKRRAKEISFYLKELTLYNTSLVLLTRQTPLSNIKDELLNIAVACIDESYFYDFIRANRKLPIKKLSEFTYKSKTFLEKWQHYILAYFLLLSNTNYHRLKSYLNIKNTKVDNIDNDVVAIQPLNHSKSKVTGVIMKAANKSVIVLTPQGDFIKLKSEETIEKSLGSICSGTIKRDISYYKYPIIASCIGLIATCILLSYIYTKPSRTILIDANSKVTIKTNTWDKTVEIRPLSVNGSKITKSISLFNKSMDDSIYLILKTAYEKAIINGDTKITIFITGSKKESPNLIKASAYISEHNLQVSVNNNGIEHKLRKPEK